MQATISFPGFQLQIAAKVLDFAPLKSKLEASMDYLRPLPSCFGLFDPFDFVAPLVVFGLSSLEMPIQIIPSSVQMSLQRASEAEQAISFASAIEVPSMALAST